MLKKKIFQQLHSEANWLLKNFSDYPDVPSIILRPRGLFGVGDTSILPRVLRLSRTIGIPLIRGGEQLMDCDLCGDVA